MIHCLFQPRTVPGETRDCGLRAVCAATGAPYDRVWAMFKKLGRRKRGGCYSRWVDAVLRAHGKTRRVRHTGTVRKFIRSHPTGKHVLHVSDHFVALIDGHLWDDWDFSKCEQKRVKYYWKIS